MKKLLFILTLSLLLIACKKDFSEIEQPIEPQYVANKVVPAQVFTLGDPNRTPDGRIVYNELGWISDGVTRFGIMAKDPILSANAVVTDRDTAIYGSFGGTIKPGDIVDWVSYECPIENVSATSGQPYSPYLPSPLYGDHSGADMVIMVQQQGTPVLGGRYYRLDALLGRETFISENGFAVPVNSDYKFTYEKTNTDRYLPDYNPVFESAYNQWPTWGPRHYNWDTTYVHPGQADKYINKILVEKNRDGEYASIITFNPKGNMRERDYSNNSSVLHFNRSNGLLTRNFGDFSNFKALPVNSVTVTAAPKGKPIQGTSRRGPIISWDCPYHGTGVWHSFTIRKYVNNQAITLVEDLVIPEGEESKFQDATYDRKEGVVIYTVEIKLRNGIFPVSEERGDTYPK